MACCSISRRGESESWSPHRPASLAGPPAFRSVKRRAAVEAESAALPARAAFLRCKTPSGMENDRAGRYSSGKCEAG